MCVTVISMFLGVCISDMELGRVGWGLMIGWTIWALALPLVIEMANLAFGVDERFDVYRVTNGGELKKTRDSETKAMYRAYVIDQTSFAFPYYVLYRIYFIANSAIVLKFQKYKGLLLLAHIGVSFGFTLALVVVIAVASDGLFPN